MTRHNNLTDCTNDLAEDLHDTNYFSATAIDNILTNSFQNDIRTGIIRTDISDHLPVFINTNIAKAFVNSNRTLKEILMKHLSKPFTITWKMRLHRILFMNVMMHMMLIICLNVF